ncbi:MAG TPA: hypothetical protein VFE85_00440 [Woeseiaceae bacterium]|nr:hypothetical protein [Woeseiaceae bacterium]
MHGKRGERDDGDDLPVDDDIDDDDSDLDDDDDAVGMDDDDDDDTDNVGDISVEVNVEELMAQLERAGPDDIARKKEIRRRLEEIQEQRNIDDTYSFDLYGDD